MTVELRVDIDDTIRSPNHGKRHSRQAQDELLQLHRDGTPLLDIVLRTGHVQMVAGEPKLDRGVVSAAITRATRAQPVLESPSV